MALLQKLPELKKTVLFMAVWWLAVCSRAEKPFVNANSAESRPAAVLVFRVCDKKIRMKPAAQADLRALLRECERALISPAQLRKWERQAYATIATFTRGALLEDDPEIRARQITALREIAAALENRSTPPVPRRIDFMQSPWVVCRALYRPIGIGQSTASNLDGEADSSKAQPTTSSFWRAVGNIRAQDLYSGFGRSELPSLTEKMCTYAGPKTSYGMNPGCEVYADGVRVKLKFAEVSSEPFVARIFHALGYNVDPTDYASAVRVRYDRRLFQQFHSRKPLKTAFTAIGFIPIYQMNLQRRFDPFDCIAWAVLKDGTRWSGHELKEHLFRNPHGPHPEEDGANFLAEIEASLDHLMTVAANVQVSMKTEGGGESSSGTKSFSIGPWDYGELGHADLRELRGAGLLAAWLGWFDCRAENTRLRVVEGPTGKELVHYFSDLGSALGETKGFLHWRGEQPAQFPWTFTAPGVVRGSGRMRSPFRITNYRPLQFNAAFAAMTEDDARWMGRLIGQLTERQIRDALMGAGYEPSLVMIYTAKLVSRRDKMIQDLGLAGEVGWEQEQE